MGNSGDWVVVVEGVGAVNKTRGVGRCVAPTGMREG